MVNYEEAKKIALESLGEMAIHINEAFETEDAYMLISMLSRRKIKNPYLRYLQN